MVKLSAVIITFNEEKNIERCLESLQGIVDEIVVVDSFSKDKTQEICQKYSVKFEPINPAPPVIKIFVCIIVVKTFLGIKL